MKLYLSLTAVLMLLISTNLRSQFSGGAGTATDPYQIASRQDVEELSDSVINAPAMADGSNWSAEKYFILTKDITDSVRTSVSNANEWRKAFQGDFNGNGKKITLAISNTQNPNSEREDGRGLFSGVANAAVYDLAVDGYVKEYSHVGSICGNAWNSDISNCVSYCEVTGEYMVGGICGRVAEHTNVSNCANYGRVQSTNVWAGGIGGCVDTWIHITNCVNYGDVVGVHFTGGICGECEFHSRLSRCKNYGKIVAGGSVSGHSSAYTGGIVGIVSIRQTADTLTNCHNYGDVTGLSEVGGIAGYLSNETTSPEFCILSHCTNAGAITATTYIGGIIGGSGNNVNISHCINIGTVLGDRHVGGITSGRGLLSAAKNTSVYCCHNAGLVTGTYSTGGIQGVCDGEIINCLNTGVVKSPTNNYSELNAINGSRGPNTTIKNCHFDKQMCWNGAEESGQIGSYLTKETIGTNLQTQLGATDWSYDNANLYPTLKYFAKDSIGLVAASPVYLFEGWDWDYDSYSHVRADFKVNLENNVKWNRIIGNVDIINEDGILLKSGIDTLVCSLGHLRKLVPIVVQYRPLSDTRFTIRASEHKLVAPTAQNYHIPIYIKADANIIKEQLTIERLIIEIDKRVFYAKSSDNGTITNKTLNENIVEISIENIAIPQLRVNQETILFNLIGDMLLGDIDSSAITINPNIEFSETINHEPVLQNGSITLNICREGDDRFVTNAGKSPSIIIKNNPAREFLEVECDAIESGNYTLEVVDMAGHSTKVEEVIIGDTKNAPFGFTLPIENLSAGNYLLILTYKGYKYSAPFIVEK